MIPVSLRIDIGMARRNGTTGCISLWSAALVLALPLLFPILFPAAIWRSSLFSEWEAPKARHAVLLNSLLTTRFNEREAENLWEPPDSEGWEPCTQPLSEPCMLSSTLGTFQFKDCKECMLDLPCFLFLVCFPMSSDVCLVECSSACRIKRLLTSIFGRRTQSTAYGG